MSEIAIVMKREFLERVRTRSFLISTVAFPLLMAALVALPALVGSGGGGERELVLVDEAPTGIGERVAAVLSAAPESEEAASYRVERVAGPFAGVREELIRRVQSEEIDGYVYLPADLMERNEVVYRARDIANMDVIDDLRRAASEGVQAARLREAGLDVTEVATLVRPVELQTARITTEGETAGSAVSTFFLAYIVGFLIYMMILIYAMNVMRSVLEEKTNRIAEVIVSSMKASHLMLGKILGVGGVALLQVAIWATFLALLASQSETIAQRFGLPPGALDAVRVEPGVGVALVGFFLLGFFLYAGLYAALGAAVNTEQEAQQLQTIVLLPLFVPLLFMVRIIGDPLGEVATILGMIPFTAPMTMPMRMAATGIPAVQIVGSLALLALTVVFVAWLAGKIYRVGILSTGKRPTLRELGRWLRTA